MSRITYSSSEPHQWEIVDNVMVTVTRTQGDKIPLESWDPFIEALQSQKIKRLFALVIGAATIDATQRKTAADTFRGHGITTAVVSDHRMTRGVLTALSWLGADVKPFPWSELEAAVTHISDSQTTSEALTKIAEQVQGLE
ncbi:MAG: hypothetical protein AAF799_20435 [Myxococcota bacterium]